MKAIVNRALVGVLLWFTMASLNPSLAHEPPVAFRTLPEPGAGLTHLQSPTPVFPRHCEFDYPLLSCGDNGLSGKLALSYIPLGFEHILFGVDHLLFVLGLMWLVSSPWMLLKTITSFTVAHSLTLAAVTLGYVGVSEFLVNAMIALSIAIVAVEILKQQQGKPSFSARKPWLIAGGFGLIHGLGLAGALTEQGLRSENLPSALLFFNIGIELGQLAFVLLVLALIWSHRTLNSTVPRWSQILAVYGLGITGSYWFVTRFSMMIGAG